MSFSALGPYVSAFGWAALTTLWMSCVVFLASGILGAFGVVIRVSSIAALRAAGRFYVEVLRGVPILVLLYVVFFGFPAAGIPINGYEAALLALTANTTAYMIEIYRGGLDGVHSGQREAATALTLSKGMTWRHVLLPQAMVIALPALGNQLEAVVLGSSLAELIGVNELTHQAYFTGSATFQYFTVFLVVGAVYIVIAQLVYFVFRHFGVHVSRWRPSL